MIYKNVIKLATLNLFITRFYDFYLLRNYRNITNLKELTLRFYDFNFSHDYGNTITKSWIDTIIFCIYILK